mmetsp:Transcript_10798/g.15915  ORF Transcript_10798/g.15915 Transcript_10798/m.15915 type:complete len:268 (+) Transcript_10798:254-1057(+)
MSYYNNGIIPLPACADSGDALQRNVERDRNTQNNRSPSLAFYASPGGVHLHNLYPGTTAVNSATIIPNNQARQTHDQSSRTMDDSVSGSNVVRTNYGATDPAGYQISAPPRSGNNGNLHCPHTFNAVPTSVSTHTCAAPRSGNNPTHHFQYLSNHGPTTSNASTVPSSTSADTVESSLELGGVFVSSPARRAAARRAILLKPDIGIILSFIAFIVWIRLFQTMFYNSVLGHLEGPIRDIFMVLLVWIPSIMLTCFYYRSDYYQQRLR